MATQFPPLVYLATLGDYPPVFDWDFLGSLVTSSRDLPEYLLGCSLMKESFTLHKTKLFLGRFDFLGRNSRQWSAQWKGRNEAFVTLFWDSDAGWKFKYVWHGKILEVTGDFKLNFSQFYGKLIAPQLPRFVSAALQGVPVTVVEHPQHVQVPVTLPDGVPLSLVIPLHPTCVRNAARAFLELRTRHYSSPVQGCVFLRQAITFKTGEDLPAATELIRENYTETGIPCAEFPERDEENHLQVFSYRYALEVQLPHFLVSEVCEALAPAVAKNPSGWMGSYLINTHLEMTGSCTITMGTVPDADHLYWFQVPEGLRRLAQENQHYPPTPEKIEKNLGVLETAYTDGIRLFESIFTPKDQPQTSSPAAIFAAEEEEQEPLAKKQAEMETEIAPEKAPL